MPTTNERINMISAKRAELDTAEALREKEEAKHRRHLRNEILDLDDRIADLLAVANALKSSGFLFNFHDRYGGETCFASEDARLRPYGYNGGLITDGIRHHVGFVAKYHGYGAGYSNEPIVYLGIEMGGACGDFDFMTNGHDIISYNRTKHCSQSAPAEHMKKFLEEFDWFESALYAWVDATFGKEE